MSIAEHIDREIEDARAGKIAAAHFRVVCSSWSVLNRLLNGGTRTREKPLGNNSLLREKIGNAQMKQMFRLIDVFDKLDIPWTVENPESSALFWLHRWKNMNTGPFTTVC